MAAAPRDESPTVIVTSGEPAGVGPDLCLALATRDFPARLLIAADPELLAQRAAEIGLQIELDTPAPGSAGLHRKGRLQVVPFRTAAPVVAGKLDPRNATYVLQMLAAAADGCSNGRYQAMVTAPVQKSTINDAGVPFSGHTEFLAERTGTARPVNTRSSARPMPIKRGKRTVPPSISGTPQRRQNTPITASVLATRRSAKISHHSSPQK